MINSPQTAKARGRPRAFSRDKALSAAAQTFWRLGYEGASIVDLTAAMGITAQSLYAAFGSKAALYEEALDAYQTSIGAYTARALAEESTAIGACVRVLIESALEFTRSDQPKGCMISTATLACAEEHRPLALKVAALRSATLAAFEARLDRGIAEGDLDPDSDIGALARFMGAIIQGMSVQAQDGASQSDLMRIAQIAQAELSRHGHRDRKATVPVIT